MSLAGFRSTTCEQCGKRFMDDCGDAFCSPSCENTYNSDHELCGNCGEEYSSDELNVEGLCKDCEEELEEEN